MIKFPATLSSRLTLWYALAFMLLLTIAFGVLYVSIDELLDSRIDEDLIEDVEELKILFETEGMQSLQSEIDREQQSGDTNEFFIRILDAQAKEIYASDLTHWTQLNTKTEAIEQLSNLNTRYVFETAELENQEEASRIIYGSLNASTIIHIGESTEEKVETLERLFSLFAVILIVVVPLASLIGWLIARKATQGIKQVSRAAQKIERGHLEARVSVKNQQAEIQVLAQSFNAMAMRIRNLIQEMREMIDNIAHDLRSPLGRIRAISESTLSGNTSLTDYQNAASDTLEECDRLIHLINTSLDVAEAEAGVAYSKTEELDISSLTREACELFEPVAEQKEIKMGCKTDDNCRVLGNRPYLQRVIANLIDNALKYTPSNGRVSVVLKRYKKSVKITVEDNGRGIPVADTQRIFDRFYRCDSSRSGSGCGLGLSFARAVARSHGGEIELSHQTKQGAVFTLTLPLAHAQ